MNIPLVLKFLLVLIVILLIRGLVDLNPILGDQVDFHREVAAILETVDSEESAIEAARQLEEMMPNVQELNQRWVKEFNTKDYPSFSGELGPEVLLVSAASRDVQEQVNRLILNALVWPVIHKALFPLDRALGPRGWDLPE